MLGDKGDLQGSTHHKIEAPQHTQRQVRTCGDGQSGNLLQELAVAQCAMPGRAVFLGQRAGERGRGDRDKAEQ